MDKYYKIQFNFPQDGWKDLWEASFLKTLKQARYGLARVKDRETNPEGKKASNWRIRKVIEKTISA